MISILKDNFDKILFLGNKRNNNAYNPSLSQNENKIEINKYINNKNEINNEFEIKNYLNNKIDKINMLNNKTLYIENTTNIINRNNEINLNEEDLGDNKKVVINNKSVFVNKLILKEKDKNIKKKIRNPNLRNRISKYRGVSKNGAGWQTIMMFKKNRPYIGTYNSEELAARIYDIASIKKKGIKYKTNFLYNNEQIYRILNTDINFNDPNISKIISELIK